MLARLIRTFLLFLALMVFAVSLRAEPGRGRLSADVYYQEDRTALVEKGGLSISMLEIIQNLYCNPTRTFVKRDAGGVTSEASLHIRADHESKLKNFRAQTEAREREVLFLVKKIYDLNSLVIDKESVYTVAPSKTDARLEARRQESVHQLVTNRNKLNQRIVELTGVSLFDEASRGSASIDPELPTRLEKHFELAKSLYTKHLALCEATDVIANAAVEDVRSRRVLNLLPPHVVTEIERKFSKRF